ncbi:MAG TPA: hypothetical protein VJQ52_23930 [Steroidobacteraceae bacterium]|nr:hypothetical protein [Steroidobacteraceae bacterium]
MALPRKLLAAIGTAGVACAAMSAQVAPVKDPDAVVCDGVDARDPSVPPEIARRCAKVRAQQPSRPPGTPTPSDSPRPCASCGSSADPFRDPWLIGPAPPAGNSPGTGRLDRSALEQLEGRIRDLEKSAYFEVVSPRTGKTIFRVGPGGARFFNERGEKVADIGTPDAGGYFAAYSSGGSEASIGASGTRVGVRILQSEVARIDLGSKEGPFGLRFPVSKDGLLAGIGESRAGSGAVLVGTSADGATAGSIIVSDERAVVSMTKSPGRGGVAFAQAKVGGGVLDVATTGGVSAVKMGHKDQRYGIVLAGPALGFPYVPRSGLPGSYFVGCASGEKPACLPEVAPQ